MSNKSLMMMMMINRRMDVSSSFDTNESFKSDVSVFDVEELSSDVEVLFESYKPSSDVEEWECDISRFNPCTI